MLHDHAGKTFPKGPREAAGCLRVQPVVVRKLLALQQDLGPAERPRRPLLRVHAPSLMGVLAVSQRAPVHERRRHSSGQFLVRSRRLCGRRLGSEPARDGAVVGLDALEGGHRQAQPRRARGSAGRFDLCEDRRIVKRADDDRHGLEILGPSAHQGGATDVDLLDGLVARRPPGDGLLEGVEVHHHEVEGLDPLVLELS